jgi:hypothetical protein
VRWLNRRFARDAPIEEVFSRYERTAREWSVESVEGTDVKSRKANRLFDENRVYLWRLREDERGRALIETLLADADPGVRLKAAAHTLEWNPEAARPVLEAVGSLVRPWQHAHAAKMTVREFDAGRLRFDY